MPKLRIGVLMGGKSIEKEVSFNSGRTVCDHLDATRFEIIPIFQTETNQLYILPWHFLHRGKIDDFIYRLQEEAERIEWDMLKQRIDFVYIALHGRYGEDGCLQGFLEVLGIPYLGSKLLGSALGMDKIMSRKFLQSHSIVVPACVVVTPTQLNNFEESLESLLKEFTNKQIEFPCIVKPYKEGSSFGVTKVETVKELCSALKKACFINKDIPQNAIIEELIVGLEFTCILIADIKSDQLIPLSPTEIVPNSNAGLFDYEQKYMPGKAVEFTPARTTADIIDKIQQTCLQVASILEMTNLARIDGFVRKRDNAIVVIDPNTLSGMAPSSFLFQEAALYNMNHTQLINHLIETELQSCGIKLETDMECSSPEVGCETIHRKRIGILMGGNSNEREISLESGKNVTYKLSPSKYNSYPIFVDLKMQLFSMSNQHLVMNSTNEIESAMSESTNQILWHNLPQLVDFVFIGLHGGCGENGAVQGTLEMLGVPYNGSSILTSSLCMNKFKTTQFLSSQGFEVPKAMIINNNANDQSVIINKILNYFKTFPLILKPNDEGCSVLVQKVSNETELLNSLNLIFQGGKQTALVEEYINGMELTVAVVGNEMPIRVLPPSQCIKSSDLLSIEEKFLPGAGANLTPAPLPVAQIELVQRTMLDVYKTIDARGYARIDCFYQNSNESSTGKERVVIIEINTLPGLTPATCIFHQAAEVGIKPMELIDKIITLGFEQHHHCGVK